MSVPLSVPWDDTFEALLREVLPRLSRYPALEPSTPLTLAGLDSITAVEILVRIEDTYGISIPDEGLARCDFDTPELVWALKERGTPRQAASPPPAS